MDFNIQVEKNTPLRIKIADQLRYLIQNEYPDGGQIPSEEELSNILGISRGTLDKLCRFSMKRVLLFENTDQELLSIPMFFGSGSGPIFLSGSPI